MSNQKSDYLPVLFPTDPDAIILQRLSGYGGSWIIWKKKTCIQHFHYSYSICGCKEEGTWAYAKPDLLEDEALKMCAQTISEQFLRQIRDEADGQLKH